VHPYVASATGSRYAKAAHQNARDAGLRHRRRCPDTRAIFATDRIVHDNPNAICAFLKGWFETIADERAHRDETIAYAVKAVRRSAAVEAQQYDTVMPMYSADGKFPKSGLDVVRQSFVEMKIRDSAPDLTTYYTEEFPPKTN
jgi:ABC-type nitrate/sulfonate/bicarbonate transport system substrate-binding protein